MTKKKTPKQKQTKTKTKQKNVVTTVLTPDDCSSNQFFCDDDCHPISIRCNGEYDCADRSDEEHCSRPTRRPPTYPCPQHTCPNGQCYSENQRCDGISQCDDGTDETGCKLHCISNNNPNLTKKKKQKKPTKTKHKALLTQSFLNNFTCILSYIVLTFTQKALEN